MAVDLGSYNPISRQNDINTKLESKFDDIRKRWISKNKGNSKQNSVVPGGKDSMMLRVNNISELVLNLTAEVDAFPGPHFTKLYRTLSEKCVQFQISLDKIGVEGREDVKRKRKEVLLQIEAAAKALDQKTHPDGILCPECELKSL